MSVLCSFLDMFLSSLRVHVRVQRVARSERQSNALIRFKKVIDKEEIDRGDGSDFTLALQGV